MQVNSEWKDYEVIATGDGNKLERWGKYVLLQTYGAFPGAGGKLGENDRPYQKRRKTC